jgi:hypothetical protein
MDRPALVVGHAAKIAAITLVTFNSPDRYVNLNMSLISTDWGAGHQVNQNAAHRKTVENSEHAEGSPSDELGELQIAWWHLDILLPRLGSADYGPLAGRSPTVYSCARLDSRHEYRRS